MKIHEYQAKEILRQYGVPTPRGIACMSAVEAVPAAQDLGGKVWVVKAQIHAGGRGKGGGVKVAKSLNEVADFASQIFGMQLVTHQTGPVGQKVRRLLIEEGADIRKELYVGMVIDRKTQRVVLMASSEGGMDIEEVAAHTPEKIHKVFIDPAAGLQNTEADEVARKIGVPEGSILQARICLQGLYKAFESTDADLAEINPLVLTGDGKVIALDAKMNFDSNAMYRHPEIQALRDLDEEDPAEVEASKFDLAYISLDGNIGCLVNGAGLAMATMDTIKLYGGNPANFLDVGGGATAEKVTEAFKIMLKNPNCKAILVNIFGGIMKCDTIANGVITAAREVKLSVPLVVRMKGTNEELGKQILAQSGLPIIAADTMSEAAEKVVAATNEKSNKNHTIVSQIFPADAHENGVKKKMSEHRYDDENPDSIADGESLYETRKKPSVMWWLIPLMLGLGALLWFGKDSRWVKPILGIDSGSNKNGELVRGVIKSEAAPNINSATPTTPASTTTASSTLSPASSALGAGKFGEWQLQSTETGTYTVSGKVPSESAKAELLSFLNNQLGAKVQDKLQIDGAAAAVKTEGLAGLMNWLKNFPGIGVANTTAGLELSGDAPSDNMRGEMFKRATELMGSNGTLVNKLTVAGQTATAAAVAPNFAPTSAPTSALTPSPEPMTASTSAPPPAPTPALLKAEPKPEAKVEVKAEPKPEPKPEVKPPSKPEPAKELKATKAILASKAERIQVLFNMSSSELRPESTPVLMALANRLIESKQVGEIAGHTDNRGDPVANLALSQARAESVRVYLTKQGVPEGQLTAKGYGQTKPLNDNSTVMERQQNRRIEFIAN